MSHAPELGSHRAALCRGLTPHNAPCRYLLWFWSSYLFIACILAAVVLTSAAVQMYIAHRCQKAMAKVIYLCMQTLLLQRVSDSY